MIEEKIKKKGLFKISNELGVKPQRVSNWMRRKSYPKKFLKPLAKVLNMEIEKLIDEVVKEEL
jgi:transcriptional regulator with XRE-family HTH domain